MSEYQVIARKWRPQRFSDVVGQEHVVRTLRNEILSDRTAHAYLFVGPRGVGKTTLARIFAKAMNCLDPQQGEPCCRCESCRAIAEERNLDVLEVDAASRNTTGDMRELAEDVLTQPVNGRYKIYIIDEVHMLSKQAWNVLLKTVEEPPPHVKFIFATTEVHQVLPTIISRCQRFDLLPIPTRLIAERLKLICETEKVGINDGAINAIARAAEGGMRDAQSLLDQMIAFFSQGDGSTITGEQVLSLFGLTDHADLDALLVAMLRNQPGEVVSIIARLSKKGKNLETLFDDLLSAVRAVQLCTILRDPGELLDESPEMIERFRRLGALVKPDTIQILLETIAPVGRILHDALNKQVYLETILLKAMREAHAVRIDDLLARLNQLRTAGELKFLDQLPAGKVPVAAPSIEPLPSVSERVAEEKVPQEAPAEEEKAKPAPQPEVAPEPDVAPVADEKKPEQSGPYPEIPAEPEVAPEPEAASVPDGKKPEQTGSYPEIPAEPEVAPEPEAAPVADEKKPEQTGSYPEIPAEPEVAPEPIPEEGEPEQSNPYPEIPAEPAADGAGAGSSYPEIPSDAAALVSPSPAPEIAESRTAPGGRKHRHSIANDQPQALVEALQDPLIHEIVDLFDGKVVDIHR